MTETIPGRDADEYTINYHRCGLCALGKQEHLEELIPYMCAMDFISADLMGGVLYRTGTLAEGAEKCDFYICKRTLNGIKKENTDSNPSCKTGRVGKVEYVTVAQEGFYGLYHVPVKDHDPKRSSS